MSQVVLGDKLVNFNQVTWLDRKYRAGDKGDLTVVHLVFGPSIFLNLPENQAAKLRADSEALSGSTWLTLDDRSINLDQIAFVDLKYPPKLVPEDTKDAVHIVFTAGNVLDLAGDKARQFRDLCKAAAAS